MSLYDYYYNDISEIEGINFNDKNMLIDEIIIIVRKLNDLFLFVGYDGLVSKLGEIFELHDIFLVKRNILMNQYLRFVIMISKEYFKVNFVPWIDLIQMGNVGLNVGNRKL